jgi:formylglycine-generating enzyme required for sulfatase activity
MREKSRAETRNQYRENFPVKLGNVYFCSAALTAILSAAFALAASPAVAASGSTPDSASPGPVSQKPAVRTVDTQLAKGQKVEVVVVDTAGERKPIIAGGGQHFTDCPEPDGCPQMLVVPTSPPGVMVGSPEDEAGHRDTEKLHPITIRAFAASRYEISVSEYKACAAANGCKPPEWLEPGGQHNVETGASNYYRAYGSAVTGERQPIVGVSFEDATAYANWLKAKTGKPYRLLSETEWEYAARAGTVTAYWWGNEVRHLSKAMANCEGCGSEWDGRAPAPVDSFQPNPWGFFNVHGNVWEWVADFYCNDYETGPADGTPRLTDDCPKRDAPGLRVLRSGSTFYDALLSRAALRLRNVGSFRSVSVGFRVARTLD